MKMFNDSHLEIKKWFDSKFETHPYECGWADEAIFFARVEKIEGDPVFTGQVQISQYIGLMTAARLYHSADLVFISSRFSLISAITFVLLSILRVEECSLIYI